MLLMKLNQLLSRKKMKKLKKNMMSRKQMFPHDEPQTEQEENSDDSTKSQIKSASSQEGQQPSPKPERVGR